MPGAARYRAFISYSHGADQPLAAALARSLARFARPWWKLRAMRVFVDQHGLGANAALWQTIERALSSSEWLLLLASPKAAASPWVSKEVAWWLANRSPERIVIAQTGGSIAWQGTDFDWARTDALPAPLRGAFAHEPTWVDFSGAASWPRLSTRDEGFRAAFLRIGAPLHGLASPEDLWNEHASRWRQMVGAVIAAAVLLALALWGAWRMDQVAAERDENLDSVKLGALALHLQRDDPALAAQVALAGVARRPSGVAAAALRSALAELAGDVAPRGSVDVPGAIDLALAPGAGRLAVLTGDGRVVEIDVTTGALQARPAAAMTGGARAIAYARDGTLAVAAGEGLWLWRGNAEPRRVVLPALRRLAFSPDGTRLALAEDGGGWRVLSVADERTLAQGGGDDGPLDALAFSHDGERLATGGARARLWDWKAARSLADWPTPGGTAALDFNRDGESTMAKWMLAIAARAAPLQIVDPAQPSRGMSLGRRAVAAGFVASGRCVALAGGEGRVEVVSSFGFERLFGLAGSAGTVRAMALGATERFALLRGDARIEWYEQPLCGDAEALCRFAQPRLAPITQADRLRHLPPPAEAPVSQPPGPACKALIDRVLPGWR
ncbi:WD40 repeat domain-containing protein [Variovorax sp. YR752]|uniref:WD40 repeat domain-containing protein n=1 Tax=Variovorax sp. YR752 TaxID=1884383 RepID=UPI003137AD05